MKKVFFFSIILCFIVISVSFFEIKGNTEESQIKQNPANSTDVGKGAIASTFPLPHNKEQEEAFNKLDVKYNNKLKAIWNENGTIRSIYGFNEVTDKLALENINETVVKSFLKENHKLFSLKEDLSDLKLTIRKGEGFANYLFNQTYKEIPVDSSSVLVRVQEPGITMIGNGYEPAIVNANLPTQPNITKSNALEIAKKEVEAAEPNHFSFNSVTPKVELFIYPNIYGDGSKLVRPKLREIADYHLVWKIQDLGGWSVVIDAIDGKVLKKRFSGMD